MLPTGRGKGYVSALLCSCFDFGGEYHFLQLDIISELSVAISGTSISELSVAIAETSISELSVAIADSQFLNSV